MSSVLAVVLVSLTTATVLDALRRKGALIRPEFYLLVALYLYATGGYLTYLVLPRGAYSFLLPAGELSVHTSYLYSACAVVAVYLGGKLYDHRAGPGVIPRLENDRVLILLALAGCVLALAANTYYFATFGLFSGSFDRVEFIDDFGSGGGARIPYLYIFYASVGILALSERIPASWMMLLALAALHLPVGNRRIVLTALMIVFAAKLLRGHRYGTRFLAAALAGVLVVGVVVGNVRGAGLSAFEGFDLESTFLALSEFSRPFVTLVYYVENGYELLFGTTLLYSVTNVVPGFLLPFNKPVAPSREFLEIVQSLGVYGPGRVPGFGFFPVTEALLNFGAVGIPVFFLLFTVGLRWFYGFMVRKGYVFVVPLLCAYMFSFGRNPFSGMLAAFLWAFASGCALYFVAQVVRELYEYKRSASRSEAGSEA